MDNNQNGFEKNTYGEQTLYVAEPLTEEKKTNGFGIASLVLGIFSLLCCCATPISGICAILALVFAIVSRKKMGAFDALSIVGLVLSILGLLIFAFSLLFFIAMITSPAFWEGFFQGLEEGATETILRLLR